MTTKISKALAEYEPFYERILPTGSRVICSPPPKDTDEDYLLLVTTENLVNLETRLVQDGWVLGGSMGSPTSLDLNSASEEWSLNTEHQYVGGALSNHKLFHSWKRYETPAVYGAGGPGSILNTLVSPSDGPEINLLVTCNKQYFDDFTRATFLCQGLNLLDKVDRVTVFEALTRDVWPTGGKKKKRDWRDRFLNSIFYGEGNTVNNFTGLQTLQPLQVDMVVNPPIVAENNLMQFGVQWFNGDGTPIPAAEMAGQAG